MLRNPPRDAAGQLGKDPQFTVKELGNPSVRKAIFMAVNRRALRESVVTGGAVAENLDALCFRVFQGCGYNTKPAGYDPAAAKKLLAEAGYPKGFDLKLTVFASMRDVGQAVAGDLRKIGIRADIQVTNSVVTRKLRASGQIQAFVGLYPGGALPDASNMLKIFFLSKANDYARDPLIHSAVKRGSGTHDDKARRALYAKAFDRINSQYFALPISSPPILWAYSSGVRSAPSSIARRSRSRLARTGTRARRASNSSGVLPRWRTRRYVQALMTATATWMLSSGCLVQTRRQAWS